MPCSRWVLAWANPPRKYHVVPNAWWATSRNSGVWTLSAKVSSCFPTSYEVCSSARCR
jgi:hypothetical protein